MADRLIRVLALGGRARVVAALASDTAEELRRVHDSSPPAAAALGRLAVGALLLAASLEKVTGREPLLTVEIEGGGPLGHMVATASPAGWVRASVANPRATAPSRSDGSLDVPAVVGDRGQLVVTRDPGVGEPYRGVTPLGTGAIAEDLARYLVQSEQAPAAVVLGDILLPEGRVDRAGGFLVQLLPGVSDDEAGRLVRNIQRLDGLSAHLAADEEPASWLGHVFPDGFISLEETPVRFMCGCSMDRVEAALKLLGAATVRELLACSVRAPSDLTCGFCRTVYSVPHEDLFRLLREVEEESSNRD